MLKIYKIWLCLFLLSTFFVSHNNANRKNKAKGKKPVSAPSAGNLNCQCGHMNGGNKKIVGGVTAGNHAYPWMAPLVYIGGTNGPQQFCSSSLISDRYVLTASHCVSGKSGSLSSYQVYLGTNKINGTDAKKMNIIGITMHPNYNAQTLDNDIALVKLSQPVKMSKNIRPVCMAKKVGAYTGKTATVAGWGTQNKGGQSVNQLRHTHVRVMDQPTCQRNYSKTDIKITENMLCAYLPGKDSCSGDSGGPLAVSENNAYRQIGVVSFGIDCGNQNYPGVYARVSKYSQWIQDNTRDAKYCSK